MGILETRATGRGIACVCALVATILILAVAGPAQQTPVKRATAPAEPDTPCVQLARRTHRNERDVCLPAGRQGAIPKETQAVNLKRIELAPVNPMALVKTLAPPSSKSSPKASAAEDSGVTEFQVASSGAQGADVTPAKNSKRTFLKHIHGEAYGALAPDLDGGHAAGAAVGASSKGGKTHIFIETNHDGTSTPR